MWLTKKIPYQDRSWHVQDYPFLEKNPKFGKLDRSVEPGIRMGMSQELWRSGWITWQSTQHASIMRVIQAGTGTRLFGNEFLYRLISPDVEHFDRRLGPQVAVLSQIDLGK